MIRSIGLKILFFVASFFALYHVATEPTPPIRGDGREYILMSQSLLNHGTSNLEQQDARDVVDSFKSKSQSFNDPVLNCDAHNDCGVSIFFERAYFPNNNGKLFSYHFSFYPLVNVPALIITKLISESPTTAFYLTNTLFFIIAIYFLLFFIKERLLYKTIIIFLFASQTTISYLKWPHPEVITISMIVIALCVFKRKMFYASSLIFAFASLQYQPLGIIAALLLLYAFISGIKQLDIRSIKGLIENKKFAVKTVIYALISGFVVLTPSLFYLYNFSSPNLIASIGGARSELVSFSRFISMYYDLNQGAILLYPIVLIFSPIIFIISIIKIKEEHSRNIIIFTLISVISAIPCLTTANWNSGAENVMRYAFWVSSPLIFSFTEFVFNIKSKITKSVILLITFASQIAFITMQNNGKFFSINHVSPSYVGLAFYNHYPSLYNPEAEIYVERALNTELSLVGVLNGNSYPGYVKRGNLRKLIAPANMDLTLLNPCPSVTPSITDASDGYVYYNYPLGCKVADETKTAVVMFSPK
ncbi:hypothetical protein [Yersinia frederiksenii]|uniref:Glycosyltransferase RgtA/B/C/D-like domain-containing protein n=1 Tax=Yersinia frederiksenii TaxID=29484 RepID=A0AAI8ZP42_YERFR|nr:hypothetical protein [Yersinia frederiksenii]CFQ96082.1 Uncharacterised protein [Yersinia frederiksenii]